jgi:hypothetical protein
MKILMLLMLLAFTSFMPSNSLCPRTGNSTSTAKQGLDYYKNRIAVPTHFDPKITLSYMLLKENENKLNISSATQITGYVIDVQQEYGETCNCGSSDPSMGDYHIYIGTNSESAKKNCVIVEITRYSRATHPDWTYDRIHHLKNHRVQVQGWLLYDWEHTPNATNVNPLGRKLWRQTCNEIHPVTGIKSLDL